MVKSSGDVDAPLLSESPSVLQVPALHSLHKPCVCISPCLFFQFCLIKNPQKHNAPIVFLQCSLYETNSLVKKLIIKTPFTIHSLAVIILNRAGLGVGKAGRQLSTQPSWRHQRKQICSNETFIGH